MSALHVAALLEYLEGRPTAYVDKMQEYLYDDFEIMPSATTVKDALKASNWSRKAVQARAAERSKPLRLAWRGIQPQYDDDQLVFLDESAFNERTGDRKMGWAPVGVACEVTRPFKRSERSSVLPALDNEGYFAWAIFKGGITAEIFLDFLVEQVLPHCEPYPGRRSVIIMDNCVIHKSQAVRDACNEADVLLLFLLPYSPDYNPIEATFKDLKAWIKRNHSLEDTFETFDDFLDFAVQSTHRLDPKGHFRNAGYFVRDVV